MPLGLRLARVHRLPVVAIHPDRHNTMQATRPTTRAILKGNNNMSDTDDEMVDNPVATPFTPKVPRWMAERLAGTGADHILNWRAAAAMISGHYQVIGMAFDDAVKSGRAAAAYRAAIADFVELAVEVFGPERAEAFFLGRIERQLQMDANGAETQ